MVDSITFLLETYPITKDLVAYAIMSRVVFKTVFKVLGKYVELTKEKDDNKKLHKIMDSKIYKLIAFTLDLTTSVKLPAVKKEKDGK